MATAEAMEAASLAKLLTRWESRGPGDTENAMRRLSRRYGLDYGTLWSLRYRKPKRIWADVLTGIRTAYEAERQRQLKALAHEADLTAALAGPDRASVRSARALLGQAEGAVAPVVDEER